MTKLILIADVTRSLADEGHDHLDDLKVLVNWVNKIYGTSLESPLVITTGDSFQGIVTSAPEGVDLILAMEEYILEEEFEFKLRYVLNDGEIVSAIDGHSNELYGPGIEDARAMLDALKKEHRFKIAVGDAKALNSMMRITQSFIDGWFPKDRSTVSGFLQGHDYKAMAKIQHRDESSMWRRRRSLAIEEYLLCKDMIHHLMSGSSD